MIPKEKLRAFATSNHSSANLLVRTDRLGSAALRELEDAIHAELAAEPLPAGRTRGRDGQRDPHQPRRGRHRRQPGRADAAHDRICIFVIVYGGVRPARARRAGDADERDAGAELLRHARRRRRDAVDPDEPDRLASRSASPSTTPATSCRCSGERARARARAPRTPRCTASSRSAGRWS